MGVTKIRYLEACYNSYFNTCIHEIHLNSGLDVKLGVQNVISYLKACHISNFNTCIHEIHLNNGFNILTELKIQSAT